MLKEVRVSEFWIWVVKECYSLTNKTNSFEQAQFRSPHFQQTQSLQNTSNRYRQTEVQSTHLENQGLYIAHLQNAAIQAEQLSTISDTSVMEVFNK